MEKFFIEVMERLGKDLVANEDVTPALKKICLDIERIKAAIGELFQNSDFYMGYSLNNDNAILFNKKYLPHLLAKLFFAHLHLEFERQKDFSTREAFRDWCVKQLEKIKKFFALNWYLYTYWQADQTKDDEELFWGSGRGYEPIILPTPLHPPHDLARIAGNEFYNAGLLTLAALMAYEQYKKILKEEGDDCRPGAEPEGENYSRAFWNRTLRDLAEQVVGQYELQTTFVSGKSATLDFLKKQAVSLYSNVTMEQLDAAVRGVTDRSKGVVEYHQSIILALQGRGKRLQEGRKVRRRGIN